MNQGGGELILYRTEDGRAEIQFRAVDGTVWLTQAQMAELFTITTATVNRHIASILDDGELSEATISQHEIVRMEGSRRVSREVLVYNLDMILAVGYRVRDLFAATSADYDSASELARAFFATIQNKLLYAVTGRTAAELIVERADPARPNMGPHLVEGPPVSARAM